MALTNIKTCALVLGLLLAPTMALPAGNATAPFPAGNATAPFPAGNTTAVLHSTSTEPDSSPATTPLQRFVDSWKYPFVYISISVALGLAVFAGLLQLSYDQLQEWKKARRESKEQREIQARGDGTNATAASNVV